MILHNVIIFLSKEIVSITCVSIESYIFQVDIFRSILETLEVLKLDLANTLIAMIRPHVQQESVQYERAKFDEMLKLAEGKLSK